MFQRIIHWDDALQQWTDSINNDIWAKQLNDETEWTVWSRHGSKAVQFLTERQAIEYLVYCISERDRLGRLPI